MTTPPKVSLAEHQAEIRESYANGWPGAVISGCVWLVAAFVATQAGLRVGYLTLFFGGMLIFPLGLLVVRGLMKRAKEAAGNPGGRIVVETLPAMIGVIFVGLWMIDVKPEWAFPLAAIAVGAHYFPFRTAYGLIHYWIMGAVMMIIAFSAMTLPQVPPVWLVPAMIGATEILFGLWLMRAKPTG